MPLSPNQNPFEYRFIRRLGFWENEMVSQRFVLVTLSLLIAAAMKYFVVINL